MTKDEGRPEMTQSTAKLESQLESDPLRLDLRNKLIGQYLKRAVYRSDEQAFERLIHHCLWVVEHQPGYRMGDTENLFRAMVVANKHEPSYELLKQAWLLSLARHQNDPIACTNAARAFEFMDRDLALADYWYKEAVSRFPPDPELLLINELTHAHASIAVICAKRAAALSPTGEQAASFAHECLEYGARARRLPGFCRSGTVMAMSVAHLTLGNFVQASELAQQSAKQESRGHYAGSEMTLVKQGLLAFRQDDLAAAAHIMARLNPSRDETCLSLHLSRYLLSVGESDSVDSFLANASKSKTFKPRTIRSWRNEIQAGRNPFGDIDFFLVYNFDWLVKTM